MILRFSQFDEPGFDTGGVEIVEKLYEPYTSEDNEQYKEIIENASNPVTISYSEETKLTGKHFDPLKKLIGGQLTNRHVEIGLPSGVFEVVEKKIKL